MTKLKNKHRVLWKLDKPLKRIPDSRPKSSARLSWKTSWRISGWSVHEPLKTLRQPHREEDWLWYPRMFQVPRKGCMRARDTRLASRVQQRYVWLSAAQARAEWTAVVIESQDKTVLAYARRTLTSSATDTHVNWKHLRMPTWPELQGIQELLYPAEANCRFYPSNNVYRWLALVHHVQKLSNLPI